MDKKIGKRRLKVMSVALKSEPIRETYDDREEPLSCLGNIKNLIQQSMKENGILPSDVRRSLNIKRYEK